MIYSKRLNDYVPISVTSQQYFIDDFGKFTRYTVKDGKIPVGTVDLKDIDTGVKVMFIENVHPDLYSGFGAIADQIEVEHCKKLNMDKFEIVSEAALNSHALHYKRGKRFCDERVNRFLDDLIKNTAEGVKFNTRKLGIQKMFMPQEMIANILQKAKVSPLLK